MRDLNDLQVFVRVAEAGTFAAAARSLGLPASSVSEKLARLEAHLKTRLIERTTRRLRVTAAGDRLLEHVRSALLEIEAGEAAVGALSTTARGRLRLSVPPTLAGSVMSPIIAGYLTRHPDVSLVMDVTNQPVDLIEAGVDLCIRAGNLPDGRLVARRLCTAAAKLYACASLFGTASPPTTPQDLTLWPMIEHGAPKGLVRWDLISAKGERYRISFAPRFSSPDHEAVADAIQAGLGIGNLPQFVGDPLVRTTDLIAVLPDWSTRAVPISLLYASHKSLSPALRALCDDIIAAFERFS